MQELQAQTPLLPDFGARNYETQAQLAAELNEERRQRGEVERELTRTRMEVTNLQRQLATEQAVNRATQRVAPTPTPRVVTLPDEGPKKDRMELIELE